jgi:hypothetical protein
VSAPPSDVQALADALAAPFPAESIGWKPGAVAGGRAMALAFIDARDVMDRLDQAAGLDNWQDSYESLPDGTVVCTLSLRIGGEWLSKSDAGGESEQKDPGDRRKAAFSDALKRAAVKWGVGRFLYSLPVQWVDYDQAKRQFTRPPQLPAWALPGPASEGRGVPASGSPPDTGRGSGPAADDPDFLTPVFVSWLRSQDDSAFTTGLTSRRCELVELVADEVGQKEHRAEPQRWPFACRGKVIEAVKAFRRQRAKAVGAKEAEAAPAGAK